VGLRQYQHHERGRKIDGKIREILRWGIPEPGGTGGGKGLPASFLATALLSTQADVSAVLNADLQADPAASGKERIDSAVLHLLTPETSALIPSGFGSPVCACRNLDALGGGRRIEQWRSGLQTAF
jgi:hypothetical protein